MRTLEDIQKRSKQMTEKHAAEDAAVNVSRGQRKQAEQAARQQRANEVASEPKDGDVTVYKAHRNLSCLPIFSPTRKPSFDELTYESADQKTKLKVIPSVSYGRPTIYDQDIWLFILSRVAYAYRITGAIPREITFTMYECLTELHNKRPGGKQYAAFKASLNRLATFGIELSCVGSGMSFGLFKFHWEDTPDGDRKIVIGLDPILRGHFEQTPRLFLAPPDYRCVIDEKDSPLVKSLHAVILPLFGRNDELFPMTWERVRMMVGYSSELRNFKRDFMRVRSRLLFQVKFEGRGDAQKLKFIRAH
jgi:hypothetical protein